MPDFTKDLYFNTILPQFHADTFKQVLTALAKEASNHLNISEELLAQSLMEKEESISSSIGDGVAVPNLKIKGLKEPFTVLITLRKEINFNATDEIPVDVVCLVLSPENEGAGHLRRLSRISRALKSPVLHKKIQGTDDAEIIQSLFMDPDGWLLAA